MTTIVATSRSFSDGTVDVAAELAAAGHTVIRGDVRHDLAALAGPLAEAEAWIAGTSPVTAAHLDLAPHLKVVARYGVGTDAVDLAACAARGIIVTNTPGANTDSVAELALTLLMTLLRRVIPADVAVRAGDWTALRGREIAGLDVGVLGFGRIGRAFARRAAALGARITVCDPYLPVDVRFDEPYEVRRVAEPIELAVCHALSLHAASTTALIDGPFLARADGLTLINTARAHLVDETALAAALSDGRVAGYAGDSLSGEFATASGSPLLNAALADRVIITPHIGAQTAQAIDRMGQIAAANVLAVLAGDPPPNPVPPADVTRPEVTRPDITRPER